MVVASTACATQGQGFVADDGCEENAKKRFIKCVEKSKMSELSRKPGMPIGVCFTAAVIQFMHCMQKQANNSKVVNK